MKITRHASSIALLALGGATSCGAFGGADAGPTMGTFHVDTSNATSASVPATFDASSNAPNASSMHAYLYQHVPAGFNCGTLAMADVIGTTGLVRGYIRLPQNPVTTGSLTLGANPCGPYFTLSRDPGLPDQEVWVAQSGTLMITAMGAASFTITIVGAAMSGSSGTFDASGSVVVTTAEGI